MVKIPNAKLWSPETPHLYRFTAKYGKDEVRGCFGMRKFEKRKDKDGYLRFFLNNKPYYVLATLDQGWWPDGLLTPPSEEAMAFDIRTLKDLGFNAMRKHIKVEPLRYYHLCDTMGILVIQDLPSGNVGSESPMKAGTTARYGLQRQEQKEMMDNLQAVPSIVMWCPYNEGWGQPGEFLTHSMLDFVRHHDPTRLVNGPSGLVMVYSPGSALAASRWDDEALTDNIDVSGRCTLLSPSGKTRNLSCDGPKTWFLNPENL